MTSASRTKAGRPSPGRPARWAFLPEQIWRWDMATGRSVGIDHRLDPEAWREAANSGDPLVVQWDDGQHEGLEPGLVATSSSSAPNVVDMMDDVASREAGTTELHIGTGTGWTTARACEVLGDDSVVSVEVDAAVAARARTALTLAGYHPEVVAADGALGYAERAPYDLVFVTAGVREIPAAWLAQTRPGGAIVLPWGTEWSNLDLLLRLVVAEDGTAVGRVHGLVEFMKLRDQRATRPTFNIADPDEREARVALPRHGHWDDWTALAGLYVPGAAFTTNPSAPGRGWLYTPDGTSWATGPTDSDGVVQQFGPRRLWDELEAAVDSWHKAGEPGWDDFGVTVTPAGRSTTVTTWLNEPSNLI